MSTVRVTTFNVNQFAKPEHQRADLERRMKDSDVLLLQETVDLDLVAFAEHHDGWGAYQVRNGNNDGHANTGVLFRESLGLPSDTDWAFLGDLGDTRIRGLACVQFNEREWFDAGHIFPARDKAGIPTQLANLSKWVKAHPGPVVIGLDRNQCPPGALETATGLRWVGVGIDGFLTNCKTANVAEFPKGYSDHPGVHADVTIPDLPKPNRVQRATDALHKAAHNAGGNPDRLARIQAALRELRGKR